MIALGGKITRTMTHQKQVVVDIVVLHDGDNDECKMMMIPSFFLCSLDRRTRQNSVVCLWCDVDFCVSSAS